MEAPAKERCQPFSKTQPLVSSQRAVVAKMRRVRVKVPGWNSKTVRLAKTFLSGSKNW
jgi:hypothetical protein